MIVVSDDASNLSGQQVDGPSCLLAGDGTTCAGLRRPIRGATP
jgi:hypothetical protein